MQMYLIFPTRFKAAKFLLAIYNGMVFQPSEGASAGWLIAWNEKSSRSLPEALSRYFEDCSHRDGLSEGIVGEQRRVRLEIG
jgi:hypothetical protein